MDPVKGNVYIDDQNIKKLQIKSLRDNYSISFSRRNFIWYFNNKKYIYC